MVDHVSREKRSAIMGAVRDRNTKPEIIVRKAAHSIGLRFRLRGALPGRPDLVLSKWKTVVFVNGCFWHRHPGCKRTTTPKSNIEFWTQKFENNVRRDSANYARLADMGWRVIVFWQCEVGTVDRTISLLRPYFGTNGTELLSLSPPSHTQRRPTDAALASRPPLIIR
jgi:DNA mismatch endonuclease, patch repair protein